jgi:hypothetical protein
MVFLQPPQCRITIGSPHHEIFEVITAVLLRIQVFWVAGSRILEGLTFLHRSLAGWTIQYSNPARGKKLVSSAKCPDRPWGPHNLLFNGYRRFFPVAKRPGAGVKNE